MYVLDDTGAYGTFFGQEYDAVVQVPSKDPKDVKKEFMSLSYSQPYPQYGVEVPLWLAPNIGDVSTSIGQQSNLVEEDFDYTIGMRNAAFKRAYNIEDGVIEGENMHGMWLQLRLSNSSRSLTWISSLYVNWMDSPKNF